MTQETSESDSEFPGLRRDLNNRHIQLITIGGAIGVGLFMGSGRGISLAGPSILLAYLVIGLFLFFVIRAMGELLLSNLHYKSFRDFTGDIVGPWAGFFMGWTYWFCWIVTGIAEVVVVSAYMHFWFPDLPAWISSSACVVLLLLFNLATVKMFGELEFWFALVKIAAIVILIVMGLGMVIFKFHSPSGTVASVSHLWN
ncbi:MAG: amino acid permease, partial [Enterobacteriaceae bacterium]